MIELLNFALLVAIAARLWWLTRRTPRPKPGPAPAAPAAVEAKA